MNPYRMAFEMLVLMGFTPRPKAAQALRIARKACQKKRVAKPELAEVVS